MRKQTCPARTTRTPHIAQVLPAPPSLVPLAALVPPLPPPSLVPLALPRPPDPQVALAPEPELLAPDVTVPGRLTSLCAAAC